MYTSSDNSIHRPGRLKTCDRQRRRQPKTLIRSSFAIVLPVVALTALAGFPRASSQVIHIDDAKTQYTQSIPRDVITRLQSDIEHGKVTLAYDSKFGYLPALLKALHISTSSQVLVFSKTSVQKELISPETPRAIYFNDRSYVGFVPNARALELCTSDPYLGAVYYTLLQREVPKPKFFRTIDACLECHADKTFKHLPQHIMLSSYCNTEGAVLDGVTPADITDSMPLEKRFAGWFVTGSTGRQHHVGNSFATLNNGAVTLQRKSIADVPDINPLVDSSQFITPYSDIVPLMVLAHQYRVQNLITDATYQVNSAMAFERLYPRSAPIKSLSGHSESTENTVRRACDALLDEILFTREAHLSGALTGNSGFVANFEKQGPFDHLGRSLRTLDLKTRLFRYPCSYLIYTDNFDGLPTPAKRYFYRRLWAVLESKAPTERYAHLNAADREAIKEILLDTKPDFKLYRR